MDGKPNSIPGIITDTIKFIVYKMVLVLMLTKAFVLVHESHYFV